jgi:trans-aconitate 2-methyltransferase
MSWDPAQYLKYANERLRPALDLLARLPIEAPRTVVDWAAARGMSRRFSPPAGRARIVGVDYSAAMLAQR